MRKLHAQRTAELSVEQTLALWKTMEALKVPLCSPSCANTEGTDAKDAANQPTALGRYYRSITPENPDGDQTIKAD